MTMSDQEFVCPIGKEVFHASEPVSGTMFGRELDLKPYGAIAAPWPIPKCPSNGFVIFSRKISDADLNKLEPYVRSAEYVALKDTNTNYYLAAQLKRKLGASATEFANTMLQATWEAKDPSQYRQYATETLTAIDAALTQPDLEEQERLNLQFVAGELERRIGNFDAAKARFHRLITSGSDTDAWTRQLVDYELSLIDARDTGAHRMPKSKQ